MHRPPGQPHYLMTSQKQHMNRDFAIQWKLVGKYQSQSFRPCSFLGETCAYYLYAHVSPKKLQHFNNKPGPRPGLRPGLNFDERLLRKDFWVQSHSIMCQVLFCSSYWRSILILLFRDIVVACWINNECRLGVHVVLYNIKKSSAWENVRRCEIFRSKMIYWNQIPNWLQ